jgi:superfamily I DNA and RNA helicase
VLAISANTSPGDLENSQVVTSLAGFDTLLGWIGAEALEEETLAETRSVIEGAKALARPQKRAIEDADTQQRAMALAKLEAEIANFDQRQRRTALVRVRGPQRIRGLAGSGKTVILAMMAAHLHLNNPDDRILVTFFTRSLRASLRNLITRSSGSIRTKIPTGISFMFDTGGEEQGRAGLMRTLAGDMGVRPCR